MRETEKARDTHRERKRDREGERQTARVRLTDRQGEIETARNPHCCVVSACKCAAVMIQMIHMDYLEWKKS